MVPRPKARMIGLVLLLLLVIAIMARALWLANNSKGP
jgi:hypothetical protein